MLHLMTSNAAFLPCQCNCDVGHLSLYHVMALACSTPKVPWRIHDKLFSCTRYKKGVAEASWHLVPLTITVLGCYRNYADQAIVFSALTTDSMSLGMFLMPSGRTTEQSSCFQVFLMLSDWKLFPVLPLLSFCAAFQNFLLSVTGFIADLNRLCRLRVVGYIHRNLWFTFNNPERTFSN